MNKMPGRDFFIPRSKEELEQLVGKSVGIILINRKYPAKSLTFTGINPRNNGSTVSGQYEFVEQQIDSETKPHTPLNNITWFMQDCAKVEFTSQGINLFSSFGMGHYRLGSPEYEERLQLLKQNNQWIDPQ